MPIIRRDRARARREARALGHGRFRQFDKGLRNRVADDATELYEPGDTTAALCAKLAAKYKAVDRPILTALLEIAVQFVPVLIRLLESLIV